MTARIVIVAGEASGDLLGGSLAQALRQSQPDIQIAGVCGPAMRAAGVEAWHDCSTLSVMGIVEVLKHLPRLLRFRKALIQQILDWKPDVVVGIDAPDFNLGLEKRLKARGIRTLHYVSPSIWAWREGRAAKIQKACDEVLCLFPMEPPIYARYGAKATLVGHPLADEFPIEPDTAGARRRLGLDPDARTLALLPGSRLGEIHRLLPTFLDVARSLAEEQPDLQIPLPVANAACRDAINQVMSRVADPANPNDGSPASWANLFSRLRLIDGQSRDVLQAADVVLLASGTAALEAMLAKKPMVVAYRVAPLTYFIAKTIGLVKVDRYSLPNILAGRTVVPECMQHQCTADVIRPLVRERLSPSWPHAERDTFVQLHHTLKAGAARAAAQRVLSYVSATPSG